jgi:hypothetical protein
VTPEDVVGCVTYLNQIDPRIQLNDSTTDLWFYAIESLQVDQVRWVIRDYYATSNPNQSGGVQPITPATLKHRLASMRERAAARSRANEVAKALEAGPVVRNPMSYRQRNPEEFERLMALGRDEHRADLKSRGITPPHH